MCLLRVFQVGLAQMLKGGVIMDVTNVEEARIAEEAGAVAVMALERVPADIRRDGGVARMSDPGMVTAIKNVSSASRIPALGNSSLHGGANALPMPRSPDEPQPETPVYHSPTQAVTIPVMAKSRIGHFVEAQILEALGIDYIDESEVLTPADEVHHTNKHNFKVPFVCGCRDLGEALRRIAEGCAMIRTKVAPPSPPSLLPC